MSTATNESGCEGGAKDLQLEDVGGGGSLKKGPWTSAEDAILVEYVKKHGEGNWNAVQKHSGLFRCGKSCRLRWANHLRPNLKKGAFTSEEERIIIELHAKLGNKWARMAAQLPGRTDNEIKNYWNTRIKRRQRAGLPLYPPDLHLQQSNDNPQSDQPVNGGDASAQQHHHDFLPSSKLDIPNVTFDSLKPGLTYPSFAAFPEVSMGAILNQPQVYGMVNPIQRTKRNREAGDAMISFSTGGICPFAQFVDESGKGTMEPCFKARRSYAQPARLDGFAQSFSYDADPNSKTPNSSPSPYGGLGMGSHALLNGNFSASIPVTGLKPELPSSQFAESVNTTGPHLETVNSNASNDPFTLSPPPPPSAPPAHAPSPHLGCLPPQNSGLLEALLHESQAMGNGGNKQSSEMITQLLPIASGNNMNRVVASQCQAEWGEYSDPITPLGGPAASVFSESTPPLSTGPWDESSSAQSPIGVNMKKEEPNEFMSAGNCDDEEFSTLLDFGRPDVSPVSDWYGSRVDAGKEQSAVSDALATLFNDDFSVDIQQLTSGTSTSNQVWGLGSCPWNNMPGVCQIADLP